MQAHKSGEETLTKAELMERADKSGISDKPIYGAAYACHELSTAVPSPLQRLLT